VLFAAAGCLILLAVALAGCTGSSTRSYHYTGDAGGNVPRQDTITETWDGRAPATVHWSVAGSGSVDVDVFDTHTTDVFAKTLNGTSEDSAAIAKASSGTWTLRYVYHAFLGKLSLNITSN